MNKVKKSLVLAVSVALGYMGAAAAEGEFVKQTFIASNKLQLPYRVAAKADPNGGKVPVVVFLHGYGQCGVDNSFTINEMTNIKSYLDGAGAPSGYKLLVPQCPNDVKWADFSMNSTTCTFVDKPSSALVAVFDLLDSYAAMADVDANRIYVTGLSMGGHGTWDAICRRPDFFAAAMPCCGGGDPACAADIAHVPVLAVHNRGDPTIPCEQTEGIVTALRALGSDVIFEKLENNTHDAWTTCYSRTDDVTAGAPNHRFVWLFAQNRATNNRPKYPRITELTAAPSGSNATISLAGVVLGTDANSVPATKYSVAYKLDGASSAVTALTDQTTDSSFTLEGLADGNHTCEVTMTTDKGRTKTKSVVFYVNTSAASDVWTSAPMDASGSSFRTDGTLLYAYSSHGGTVNGIKFERDVNLQGSSLEVAFAPNIDSFTSELMNEEVGGDFGVMLSNGWYWNNNGSSVRTFKLTLSGLAGGKNYLVQFLSHNYWNNKMTVSVNGCSPVHIHGENEASGKYGALITGTFTAMGNTKEVTVTFSNVDGKIPLNGIQVRELPDGESGGGGEPGPVDPDPVPTCSLTIPAKTGIVLQSVTTNGVAVAAVAGSYTIVSNTQVTVNFAAADGYEILSGNPVVFTLSGDKTFADADYPVVQATSGGGGGDEPGPVPQIPWTVAALPASDETMLRTDGTLLYAYRGASTERTLGGVTFQAGADLSSANISFNPTFNNADENAGSSSLLGTAWNFGVDTGMGEIHLTLSGLTTGHAYLLQILARNSFGNPSITIGDLPAVSIQNGNGSSGATVYGSFTAEAASHVVTFKMGGSGAARYVAAIQVRDLGESSGGGSGGDEPGPVEPIVPGPDTTNMLSLAKIAEYPFGANGCGGIAYSGEGGLFYVLQDHDDNGGDSKIYPLTLGINTATGAIESHELGAAVAPGGLRDAEGLARDPLSGTLWVSSEWTPPSISEFALDGSATGRTAPVPSVQRDKVRSNLSLEALTISPDGLAMWTANEQALTCDGESSSGNTNVATVVRLTRFVRAAAQDAWTAAGEWAYTCDSCAGTTSAQSGLSGLCALPDGSLLALEREVSTTTCGRCRIYRLTTGAFAAATEVSAVPALTNATFSAVGKGECFLEFTGSSPSSVFGPYELIVYEGIALGPKLSDGSRAVYLVSDGGASTSKTAFGITVTATTVSCICALKLTGLPDDGTGGQTPEPEAPVIGGEGVEHPIVVGAGKVSITIGNAASGRRYGYKKSATLAGLDDAPVVYLDELAAADGALVLEVPKAVDETSCFYRIVVE
ncbi:MAG: esterase-like activity of phytase family protein [Kiritimatiellae bacterium]|nr:esterase-like activity of phytase family protein [Kiritimatiellia bacterium]